MQEVYSNTNPRSGTLTRIQDSFVEKPHGRRSDGHVLQHQGGRRFVPPSAGLLNRAWTFARVTTRAVTNLATNAGATILAQSMRLGSVRPAPDAGEAPAEASETHGDAPGNSAAPAAEHQPTLSVQLTPTTLTDAAESRLARASVKATEDDQPSGSGRLALAVTMPLMEQRDSAMADGQAGNLQRSEPGSASGRRNARVAANSIFWEPASAAAQLRAHSELAARTAARESQPRLSQSSGQVAEQEIGVPAADSASQAGLGSHIAADAPFGAETQAPVDTARGRPPRLPALGGKLPAAALHAQEAPPRKPVPRMARKPLAAYAVGAAADRLKALEQTQRRPAHAREVSQDRGHERSL